MKKITLLFLFLIGSITSSFGQLSEDFEGTWPPTGWTIESTNAAYTWEETDPGITGKSAFVPWDYDQDESLISPVFTIPAGVPSLDFQMSMGYTYGVDPFNNYDFLISISTDGGTTWTQIWDESELGVFDDYAYLDVSIPLTTYAGQTNVKLKFQYVGGDGDILALDTIRVDVPPAVVPDCATLTLPADAATGVVYYNPVVLTWTAPAAGATVSSYDVYLDTNATPTTLLGNQATLTRSVTGLLPSTTYYWTAIPTNVVGPATGCAIFSFTTAPNPVAPYCGPITFTNNVEPITLVNFAGINNATSPTLNGTPAHEIFTTPTGSVTAGSDYTITLQGNTDGTSFTNRFMVFADWNQDGDFADANEAYTIAQTITGSTGVDAIVATQSLTVPPSALAGTTRLRVKKIYGTTNYADPCLGTAYGQVEDYTLTVTAAPADLPDYVNLQFPYTATIPQGGSVVVYGRVYEGGLTDTTSGQAPGISAWVGYSTTDANPNTFTNWVPATFNVETDGNNNDEYQATIGANLLAGTYYYATRFQLNGGLYVYGGTNYGFWNGTDKINGVLTVTPPPPPANDACSGAIALTPGGVFATNPVSGTVLNATDDAIVTPSCAYNNTQNSDVWYSVVIPASGSITVETQADTANSLVDTTVALFEGTCGTLTEVACDDDSGTGLLSLVSLTGRTPGEVIYIGVWKWGTDAPTAAVNQFKVSAYDASLGISSVDNSNFTFYPNPVKNILNLSYSQEITSVDVFNLLGQKVSSNKINANSAQIDMSNLSKGAYTVRVTSNDQVKTIKVMKD